MSLQHDLEDIGSRARRLANRVGKLQQELRTVYAELDAIQGMAGTAYAKAGDAIKALKSATAGPELHIVEDDDDIQVIEDDELVNLAEAAIDRICK